jgi:hypothetical protein
MFSLCFSFFSPCNFEDNVNNGLKRRNETVVSYKSAQVINTNYIFAISGSNKQDRKYFPSN